MTEIVLVELNDSVATVTLNRPEARNALSAEMIRTLRETMRALESNDDVRAVVLTGADPAFCAGLDLKELGSSGDNLQVEQKNEGVSSPYPWPLMSKPLIGAVNGVAVTGGLELALNCDILIASERARFADTHARVGILPGWGLSVLLPLIVGRGLARRMSFTGDYLSADEALSAGLVTEMVPHDDVMGRAVEIASTIASNEEAAVRALLESYRRIEMEQIGAGYEIEARTARNWLAGGFDPVLVEQRRLAVLSRGRTQAGN